MISRCCMLGTVLPLAAAKGQMDKVILLMEKAELRLP